MGAAMHDHSNPGRRVWLLHLADYVGAAMLLDRAAALDVLTIVFQSAGCHAAPFPAGALAPLDEAGRICELLAVAERMREGSHAGLIGRSPDPHGDPERAPFDSQARSGQGL